MLDEKELKHRRKLLKTQLMVYHRKHYDGRPIIGPYLELENLLKTKYNNPSLTSVGECFDPDYWEKETSRNMQHKNRKPIIGVKDYLAVRTERTVCQKPRTATHPTVKSKIIPAPTTDPVIKTGTSKTPPQSKKIPIYNVTVPLEPGPKQNQPKNSYYKIIISWTERDGISYDLVNRAERFFEELGLEQCHIDEVTNGHVKEHSIEYKFNGTEEGYKLLKRAAMTMIDIFNDGPEQVQIAIYGKKINEI